MDKNNNTRNMPDRAWSELTTSELFIDTLHDDSDTLTTGTQQQRRLVVTIGAWNVRTLQQCGKLMELELERYRWHIMSLAEVRWKDKI